MNEQELTDKAVEDLKGLHSLSAGDLSLISSRGNIVLVRYGEFRYEWAHPESPAARCKTEALVIGNYHYLEQRARELGWINGYKWGKEYETNGKKPDLPDGIMADILYDGKWRALKHTAFGVFDFDDGNLTAFRITDERYKPVEPAARTNPENSWHERGEYPPVGVECEAYICTRDVWVKVKIVGHDAGRAIWRNGSDGSSYIGSSLHDLRPIKSERDLFIEAATSVFYNGSHCERMAAALYDAGFRKP